MKLGLFIAVAMSLFVSVSFASPLVDQASARSRGGDHARAIELYRKAYELDSNPALLVRIAHEHRLAGDRRQALAYFCSYIYVDAAGELADEASTNARALSAQLGKPTDSDHEACTTKAAVPQPAVATTTSIDMLADVIVRKPPRITKREVAGIILLGGSLASVGLALYESGTINDLREEIAANAPGTDIDVLEGRKSRAELRQKLLLGAGGLTLITGGVLYVMGRADRKRAERAYVTPSLIKNGGGLVFGGAF
jgi:hypothetical protein